MPSPELQLAMPGASKGRSRIAILVTVFNGERFVAECVRGALGQTGPSITVLVKDDGSSDGSHAILSELAARDSRVRVSRNPSNLGKAASVNAGLAELEEEWVLLVDQDDVLLPEAADVQLGQLQSWPGAVVVAGRSRYLAEDGRSFGKTVRIALTPSDVQRMVERDEPIGLTAPGILLHRETVLAAGGFRGEFFPADDLDLWCRLSERGCSIVSHEDVVAFYRIHPSSVTAKTAFEGQIQAEWALACAGERRAGRPEPTREEFHRRWRSASAAEKLLRWRDLTARRWYRLAGQHWGCGDTVRSLLHLGGALALAPEYALPRLMNQLAR